MNYNYEKAMRLTIPAVRIAVARTLRKSYNMNERDIAKYLGIAQAAVSKYLAGKYSRDVKRVVEIVESRKLHDRIVDAILSKKGSKRTGELIDSIASNLELVSEALKSD